MLRFVRSVSIVGLMAGSLALGGCATQEAVEHAQATADQALSTAQTAETAAHNAQSTADNAASAAQTAAADAQKANARLDKVEADVDHLAHHHEHGTWRDVGVKHGKHHRMPKAPTQ